MVNGQTPAPSPVLQAKHDWWILNREMSGTYFNMSGVDINSIRLRRSSGLCNPPVWRCRQITRPCLCQRERIYIYVFVYLVIEMATVRGAFKL